MHLNTACQTSYSKVFVTTALVTDKFVLTERDHCSQNAVIGTNGVVVTLTWSLHQCPNRESLL